MANKSGAIAAGFPLVVNTRRDLYSPAAGNRFIGHLRVVNQSGVLQTFRYAIAPDATPPSDTVADANWYVVDLPLDGVPFSEGIVVGDGQHLWIRASSLLVAFHLNGRENLDT
ncbi:MAG: hypothetical protein H7Z39_20635 [Burkholderiaceae bacterium]|nr:hypothetical protein [Burkholderiaceae bacterium]